MMILSPADTAQFYRLLWGLHFYAKQKCNLLPGIETIVEYIASPMEDKAKIREILWHHPELIDSYVDENPDGLRAAELVIILGWKHLIYDTFFVYSQLSNHTIFIGKDGKIFGVLGLEHPIRDLFGDRQLPIMVHAVLLPFKGKIIYDGMMQVSNVYFQQSVKSNLRNEYLMAKQNDHVITVLDLDAEAPVPKPKPVKDWFAEVAEIVEKTAKLRGSNDLQRSAFGLLKAGAKLAQLAVQEPMDYSTWWKAMVKVEKELDRVFAATSHIDL